MKKRIDSLHKEREELADRLSEVEEKIDKLWAKPQKSNQDLEELNKLMKKHNKLHEKWLDIQDEIDKLDIETRRNH